MSLNKAKVLNGPVTIIGYTGEAEVFRYEGLKKDSLSLNTEDEVEELEDRTSDLIGRNGTGEMTFSELDTTDLALINDDIDKVEFVFSSKSKKVTFTDPDSVRPKVESGKTKIIIKKFVSGDAWPFVIAAVS